MNTLTVYVNDEIAYEYDKEKIIEEQKLAFLDKIDSDMDRGI